MKAEIKSCCGGKKQRCGRAVLDKMLTGAALMLLYMVIRSGEFQLQIEEKRKKQKIKRGDEEV